MESTLTRTTASIVQRDRYDELDQLPTPALVIRAPVVRTNLKRLADYAAQHGISVRPHTKTHKSLEMGRLQLQYGARGLSVAKAGEAVVMAEATGDILVAYPCLDPVRGQILAKLARTYDIKLAVDSGYAVENLAAAARAAGSTLGILVDMDVGMGRTGLQTPQLALELAQLVERTDGVRLAGLFIYPGHIKCKIDQQTEPLRAVNAKVEEALALWEKSGLRADIVSGGSTPTAYQSHVVRKLTETRPGTYIYNDMNIVKGGYCTLDDCAARFVCTVVSTAVPNQFVIDAGSKTLTSDRCGPDPDSGHGYVVEYPQAKIKALTEEHGQVDVSMCSERPKLGERVTVIPNHICPCVNLQDNLWIQDESQGSFRQLNISARGLLT